LTERKLLKIHRKQKGIVYTPLFVVDYINRKTIVENESKDILVLDPACGNGIFLLDALFKLKQKTGKSYKEIVENNIFGIDIDSKAVELAKELLSLVVFEK
jgi:type I restriction-modification system DNA methylase subunit